MLNSGCATKTEIKEVTVPVPTYVFFIPEKITVPEKPKFLEYDATKLLNEPPNFQRLQQNTVLMKNYANSLRVTIDKYEALIDEIQETKDKMESNNDNLPVSTEKMKHVITSK